MTSPHDFKTLPVPNLIDPVRSRILGEMRVHCNDVPQNALLVTAKNLAFLVRHHAGANVELARVSLPVIDHDGNGFTVALTLHEDTGKSRVLMHCEALHWKCLLSMFAEEAEQAVFKILTEEMKSRRPVFDFAKRGR